jgi:uncharacterized protein involved in exopolysaccharide biosynthesis
VNKPRQSYGSVVDNPLESPVETADDEGLAQVELDRALSRRWVVLWAHRRIMSRFLFWGLVVSVILAFVIPKQYESTVRLMPPENQSMSSLMMMGAMSSSGSNNSGGGGSGLGMAASLLGLKSPGALFMEVLGSTSVLDAIVDRFDLRKEYGVARYEDARRILYRNTDITESRKSGIITITVTGSSPKRAQEMATAYVEELTKVINRVSTGSARTERKFLEERLAALRVEVDKSALEFSNFASKNTALDIPEQAKASLTAAGRVQAELAAAEAELKGLEQIYTPNNIRVRQVRSRIDELRRQVQTSDTGDVTGTGSVSLGQMIRGLPKLGITYLQLYRALTINELVYEALAKQYEVTRVQEAKEIPPVNVLDPANYPEKKSWPKRSLVVLLGLLAAGGLGAGWVLGNDHWDKMDPADPVRVFVEDTWRDYSGRFRRNRVRTESPSFRGDASGNGGA